MIAYQDQIDETKEILKRFFPDEEFEVSFVRESGTIRIYWADVNLTAIEVGKALGSEWCSCGAGMVQ
jgi:hypothetical protein